MFLTVNKLIYLTGTSWIPRMKWSHLFCCWYCWIDGIMCYLQSYEQILFFQFLTNNSYKQIVFQISQHPKCYISTDKHFLICILTWVWVSLISRIKEACISLLVKIKYKYGFRWKEESKNRGIPGGFVFFSIISKWLILNYPLHRWENIIL